MIGKSVCSISQLKAITLSLLLLLLIIWETASSEIW